MVYPRASGNFGIPVITDISCFGFCKMPVYCHSVITQSTAVWRCFCVLNCITKTIVFISHVRYFIYYNYLITNICLIIY